MLQELAIPLEINWQGYIINQSLFPTGSTLPGQAYTATHINFLYLHSNFTY